jgi:hypothetical protein
MKPSLRPPRTPSIISDSIHQQLNLYALAATAAGIGMLAIAQPAEGRSQWALGGQALEEILPPIPQVHP